MTVDDVHSAALETKRVGKEVKSYNLHLTAVRNPSPRTADTDVVVIELF